jgi:hypothetical protein
MSKPSNLPLWLQHHTGMVDTLTPEMVEAELKENHNPDEPFDKWFDRTGHKQHESLMDYYYAMDKAAGVEPDTQFKALKGFLARIDWHKVFIRVARVLSAVAMAFLVWQYVNYFQVFGSSAIALVGQFAIGTFFMASIMNSTNGLQILTASLGLYLLISSF